MTAAAISGPAAKLEAGAVWSDALAMVRREWRTCAVLAVVLALAPRLVLTSFLLSPALGLAHTLGIPVGTWLEGFIVGWLAATLVVTPFICLLAALLTKRFAADPLQDRQSWSEALAAGLRLAPLLYLVSFVSDVLTTLGFVLLIVPGVLLALAWSVVSPVIVLEGASPIESFRRSANLTRGSRGAILGFWLIYLVAVFLAGLVIGFAVGVIGGLLHMRPVAQSFANVALESVSEVFGIAGRAALFRELKTLKEGSGPSAAAAVFD